MALECESRSCRGDRICDRSAASKCGLDGSPGVPWVQRSRWCDPRVSPCNHVPNVRKVSRYARGVDPRMLTHRPPLSTCCDPERDRSLTVAVLKPPPGGAGLITRCCM